MIMYSLAFSKIYNIIEQTINKLVSTEYKKRKKRKTEEKGNNKNGETCLETLMCLA